MKLGDKDKRGLILGNDENSEELELNNYLLLIGIDNYIHHTKLNHSVSDCKKLVNVLTSKYKFEVKNVYELYDNEATRSNIIHTFKRLSSELKPTDTLLIYFAGHGIMDEAGDGYWIPVDAVDEASFIHNQRVVTYINQIKTLHTLLVSDSCFSGTFFRNTRRAVVDSRLRKRKSRWAITSGRDNQEVLDDSPFAKALINFLEFNEENTISATSLGGYLKEIGNNYHQIPQNGVLFGTGHESGEYIFELKENYLNAWNTALHENNIELFEAYITKYPNSPFTEEAKVKVENLKKERQEWKETIEICQKKIEHYANKFEKSKYSQQAKLELDQFTKLKNQLIKEESEQEFWNDALQKGNIESFKIYLENYPDGQYRYLADKKISVLEKEEAAKENWNYVVESAKKQKDITKSIWAIKAHIQDFPHLYSSEAKKLLEDITFFKDALEGGSRKKLREYIDRYPTGFYRSRAQKQLKLLEKNEEIQWLLETKSTSSLKEILEKNPEEFSQEESSRAQNLIEEDNNLFEESKAVNTRKAFENYLELFPNGIYVNEVRMILDDIDEREYLKAVEKNTIESYEDYLNEFKEGIYINEAKRKLQELNEINDMDIEDLENPSLDFPDETGEKNEGKEEEIEPTESQLEIDENPQRPIDANLDNSNSPDPINSNQPGSINRKENNNTEELLLIEELLENPTIELCIKYEEQYPNGLFLNLVKEKKKGILSRKDKSKWDIQLGQVVTLILSIIMLILLFFILRLLNLI